MRRIAYLTMEDPGDFAIYDHLTYEPLRRRGVEVEEVPWNRAGIDWDRFEIVVIRWPWDYWNRVDEFLSVLEAIAGSRAVLLNSLQTVKWNINKTYLRDLERQGVTIVPTAWESRPDAARLRGLFLELHTHELVIKPTVGAGADYAFRLTAEVDDAKLDEVAGNYRTRDALVQPFIPSVIVAGEYSLFWFNDQYSHAILKTPRSGDFRVQEEHGGQIRSVTPDTDLRDFGNHVMSILCDGSLLDEPPLYSRIDVVRLPDGRPALMELELIEPSLYFPWDPASPDRMADAIVSRLNAHLGNPIV